MDVLIVVDPSRSWYGGGTMQTTYWAQRLGRTTEGYAAVVMLGDSMGASASLLFSQLASHVIAFCPQVDLTTSSIRPGLSEADLHQFKSQLLDNITASRAEIHVRSPAVCGDPLCTSFIT
jgi:acetyl esterase/lipase